MPLAYAVSAARARLRVRNIGVQPIQQLLVAFPDEQRRFGDVGAGETTEYQDAKHGVDREPMFGYVWNGRTMAPFAIDPPHGKPSSGSSMYQVVIERNLHTEYVRLIDVVMDTKPQQEK